MWAGMQSRVCERVPLQLVSCISHRLTGLVLLLTAYSRRGISLSRHNCAGWVFITTFLAYPLWRSFCFLC